MHPRGLKVFPKFLESCGFIIRILAGQRGERVGSVIECVCELERGYLGLTLFRIHFVYFNQTKIKRKNIKIILIIHEKVCL